MVVLLALALPAGAQETGVRLTTPYPAVAVEAGDSVTFDLQVTAPTRQRVDLEVAALPDGWGARLRGGGFTVDGVFAAPEADGGASVQLDVDVPPGVAQDTYEVTVTARGQSGTDTLTLTLRVAEAVAGGVSLDAEFPALQGPADTQFTFDLTLANDTPEEITFSLAARGPEGWQLAARPGAEQRAVTTTVAGGDSTRIVVEVDPPDLVAAGSYPLVVRASGGGHTVEAQLEVEITGSVALTLTTPDERLNLEAVAGRPSELALVVRNDGTTPLTEVSFLASPPRNWEVTFVPEVVLDVPPGETAEVTAVVQPAREAVAGDYVLTLTASVPEATSTADIRVSVQTSRLWGAVGLGLVVSAFGALAAVFRRFGRR